MKCERCGKECDSGMKIDDNPQFRHATYLCKNCFNGFRLGAITEAELDAIRQARDVIEPEPCEYCFTHVDPRINQSVFAHHLCHPCQSYVYIFGHESSLKARDLLIRSMNLAKDQKGESTNLKLNAQWIATGKMVEELFEET